MRVEQSLKDALLWCLGFFLPEEEGLSAPDCKGFQGWELYHSKENWLSSLIGHPSGLGACHHGECKWQGDGKGGKGGWGGAALDEVPWQVCKVCMRIKSFLKHTEQLHTSARIFGVFSHLNSQVNIGRDYSVSNWAFIEILACRPNRCT